VSLAAATFVVWLVTVGIALWAVYALRQLYFLAYARFNGRAWLDIEFFDVSSYCLLPFLACGFIAFAIGTAEYHRLHLGRPGSWKLFGATLAVQLVFVLVYHVV
jgi:hypothetical protein